MLDIFGKLWLQGVKRLIKAQSTQVARQRKLHAGLQKAAVKAVVKAATTPVKLPGPRASLQVTGKRIDRAAINVLGNSQKKPRKRVRRALPDAATAPAPASTSLDAGGSWRRVFQSSNAVLGSARARRMGGWLFLPEMHADAPPDSLPLVVMLHGCGQTAPEFAAGTRMNQAAAREGFAVLYPQQSLSAHPQRCWPWYRRVVQEGGDELALIAAMVERTCVRSRLDSHRVYVAGLSAGAALAHALALRRPDLFAAVALHSGPVYGVADSRMSAFTVMQQGTRDPVTPIARLQREQGGAHAMPSLIIQGEQDQVVRPANAAQLFAQCCAVNELDPAQVAPPRLYAARKGCNAYRITEAGRGRCMLVRLVEVAHLSHAWSGGDAALRYNAAPGPDASAMLWAFFRRHVRT